MRGVEQEAGAQPWIAANPDDNDASGVYEEKGNTIH